MATDVVLVKHRYCICIIRDDNKRARVDAMMFL